MNLWTLAQAWLWLNLVMACLVGILIVSAIVLSVFYKTSEMVNEKRRGICGKKAGKGDHKETGTAYNGVTGGSVFGFFDW